MKLVLPLKVLDQLTWTKLVETDSCRRYRIRRFQRKIELADKHEAMISFYDVNIQYNLEELEKNFLNLSKI
jgi:hypothetical protein